MNEKQQTINDEICSALSYFVDFDTFGDTFIDHLRETASPTLLSDAQEWGWDDTEVRERLIDHVSRLLLDHPFPVYKDPCDIDSFLESLLAAYQTWKKKGQHEHFTGT